MVLDSIETCLIVFKFDTAFCLPHIHFLSIHIFIHSNFLVFFLSELEPFRVLLRNSFLVL